MIRSASLPPILAPPALQLPPAPPAFSAPRRTPPPPLSLAPWEAPTTRPLPPSDNELQAVISDRFADAYAAQLDYLQHAAAGEWSCMEAEIGQLRRNAYAAQNSAAQSRAHTEQALVELDRRFCTSQALRESINLLRAEISAEANAVEASRAAIRRGELEFEQAEARFRSEATELTARCQSLASQRNTELQCAAQLEQALHEARAEHATEAQAAREQARRMELAAEAKKQAEAGIVWRDSVAEQTLRQAVAQLEADFAREREDFMKEDRQMQARIREVEREARQQNLAPAAWRALARPQVLCRLPAAPSGARVW